MVLIQNSLPCRKLSVTLMVLTYPFTLPKLSVTFMDWSKTLYIAKIISHSHDTDIKQFTLPKFISCSCGTDINLFHCHHYQVLCWYWYKMLHKPKCQVLGWYGYEDYYIRRNRQLLCWHWHKYYINRNCQLLCWHWHNCYSNPDRHVSWWHWQYVHDKTKLFYAMLIISTIPMYKIKPKYYSISIISTTQCTW